MPAPENIRQLVARFEEHRESYRLGKYNEAQLRREFLDPFLEALGWDVFNKQSYAEAYKDVIHEDSLQVEGATKARHHRLVLLVERMLELHKQSTVVRSLQDKERVAREIEATDKRIDRLVYELYGLTDDEIGIVEGG